MCCGFRQYFHNVLREIFLILILKWLKISCFSLHIAHFRLWILNKQELSVRKWRLKKEFCGSVVLLVLWYNKEILISFDNTTLSRRSLWHKSTFGFRHNSINIWIIYKNIYTVPFRFFKLKIQRVYKLKKTTVYSLPKILELAKTILLYMLRYDKLKALNSYSLSIIALFVFNTTFNLSVNETQADWGFFYANLQPSTSIYNDRNSNYRTSSYIRT